MSGIKDVSKFVVKGSITAPFTPMKPNGDIDPDKVDAYVDHIRKYGIHNVYVNGTTGEGLSLTATERKTMAEVWVKACKGRMRSVIVHVGAGNLRDSMELARHAESIGADAIAAVAPTYYTPDDEEAMASYMKEVAGAAPNTPFYYYGISHITRITLSNPKMCQLCKDMIPTFRGMKHSCFGVPSMLQCLMVDGNLQVFAGTDEQYLAALAMGVEFSVGISYLGAVTNRVRDAYLAGDMATAKMWQEKANVASKIRNKHGSPFPLGKVILALSGMDVGPTRLPLVMPPADTVAKLKADLTEAGYFDWSQPTEEETKKWLTQFDS